MRSKIVYSKKKAEWVCSWWEQHHQLTTHLKPVRFKPKIDKLPQITKLLPWPVYFIATKYKGYTQVPSYGFYPVMQTLNSLAGVRRLGLPIRKTQTVVSLVTERLRSRFNRMSAEKDVLFIQSTLPPLVMTNLMER